MAKTNWSGKKTAVSQHMIKMAQSWAQGKHSITWLQDHFSYASPSSVYVFLAKALAQDYVKRITS